MNRQVNQALSLRMATRVVDEVVFACKNVDSSFAFDGTWHRKRPKTCIFHDRTIAHHDAV